jgi:tetratricopeptide (TPR) repeat protein
MLLASIYDQKGRTADAEAVLVKAAAANPEPVVLQQRLAAHYAGNKQVDQAEAVLRQIVQENPDELGHRVSLASFLSRAGKIDKAVEVLGDAIAADPDDAQRYLLLTQLLASRKSPDAAMEKLQTFIAQKPEMTELRMALVKLYLTTKQKDKARQTLEQIIDRQKLEPAGLKARVALAQLLAAENMDDERVPDLLKQVLDENPRDNDALLLKGRIAAYRKDYVDAVNDFRSVLKDQPNNAEVLQFLALAHLGNNDRELALDVLRRGVESNPDSSPLRLSLAQLLAQNGDTDAALAQLDAILKVDGSNQQALDNKFGLLARKGDTAGMEAVAKLMQKSAPDSDAGFIQEARLRFSQKDYEAATGILDRVLAKHPLSVPALTAKSDVLAAQQKYPEAVAVVEQLQKAAPDSAQGFFRMGRLLAEQSDVPGAIEQYEIALQKAPTSAEVLTALVGLEVRQGKTDDALQRLQAILKENPDHPSANDLLGVVYLGNKDYAKAEAAFQRQVELNPAGSTVYSQLAQARVGAGNLDGAAQAFEAGLTQMPGDTRLLVGLAGVRERQQAYDEAIALYEKVLETQPDNAISTNNLAALLADHRSDAASLSRAAELSGKLEKSSQPAFQDTAAWVYYRKGEYDKAAGILQNVVKKAPNVRVFQYHLGMVYYRQGDKAAAREYLTRATTGDHDYPGVEEARVTLKSL